MNVKYVSDLLDLFFKNDGHEPDWAAIYTAIRLLAYPADAVLELLRAIWAIYEEEDTAVQVTMLHCLREGL